jgi:hypothetical protein
MWRGKTMLVRHMRRRGKRSAGAWRGHVVLSRHVGWRAKRVRSVNNISMVLFLN